VVASLFAPATLPAQLDRLITTLTGVESELRGIRAWQEGQALIPEQTPIPIVISSRDQNAGIYADGRQLNVKMLWLSATLTGRYSFKIGNDAWGIPFLLQANVALAIPVPAITVARGLPITLNVFAAASGGPAGTPAWDMVVWATPGTAAGMQA